MFDNLPFEVRDVDTINSFINSGLLETINECVNYCPLTGEQYTQQIVYKYHNLTITINYSSKDTYKNLICRGSFHYLMNEGKHNANQVDFITAKNFLLDFANRFKVDLFKLKLLPPEFGLNVTIPYDIEEVIQHTFCEERKEFSYSPPHIKTSKISGSPSNENRLKLYSKSHDCPKYAGENLLRAEIQFKKTRWLKNIGVISLGDLLNINLWHKIKEKHLEDFDKMVIYDYTIKEPQSIRLKNKLRAYKTDKYWRDLIKDCKQNKLNYTAYNDKVADLNKLSKKYGSNLKEKIIELLHQEWDFFLTNDKNNLTMHHY